LSHRSLSQSTVLSEDPLVEGAPRIRA
jgi:hypothetical protein